MENLINDIEKQILECNNHINDKNIGINYLEKLKYLLIDKLKLINLVSLDDFNKIIDNEININFGENRLKLSIFLTKEPITRIKKNILDDQLSIVLQGFININLFKSLKSKNYQTLNLFPKTGIVLSKNTLINETISKNTILLNVVNLKEIKKI